MECTRAREFKLTKLHYRDTHTHGGNYESNMLKGIGVSSRTV